MASTTKTTNLELSQFVGTDKPAWLTDYNGDMQKIDDGYKKLEDANTATQADLDATKQDLSGSKTDIDDVKASVQALEAQDIALGNRLTVVEGNYDTMHHEVAINQHSIEDIETDLGMDEVLETTATTVHGAINEVFEDLPVTGINPSITVHLSTTGSDNNDGLTADKPMKTIEAAISKYVSKVQNLYLMFGAGTYEINNEIRTRWTRFVFNKETSVSSSSDVVIKIANSAKWLWADILQFDNVTLQIDVTTSFEGNRINFGSGTIVTLNGNLSLQGRVHLSSATYNMNDKVITVAGASVVVIASNAIINVTSGYFDVVGGTFLNVHPSAPTHVRGGGVLYHRDTVVPVTTSPYVAVQYS